MRICINIIEDGEPRLIEEDVEIALGKVPAIGPRVEWEIAERDGGTFTADTIYKLGIIADLEVCLAEIIEEDTKAKVRVEVFEDFPPVGWAPWKGE